MEDFLQSLLLGVKLAYVAGFTGAAFTLGVALICRWLSWAPINITVNVTRSDE